MLRIKHFSKFLTSATNPFQCVNNVYTRIFILDTSSNYGIRTCLNIPRNFYSNKCKDGSNNKVCGDKKQKEKTGIQTHPCPNKSTQDSCPDSVKLKECKPVDINPCKPPPDGYRSKLPSIQDCPSPNLFSKIPTPECSWDDRDAKNKARNRNILMLGLLVTAVTLGTLWYIRPIDYKPEHIVEEERKRKKRMVIRIPNSSSDIPHDVPYLLIGGGTASFSAFRAIKSADPTAKVLVITDESYYPYMRPPLSKEIWFNEDKEAVKNLIFKQWNGSERSLYYEPDDFYTDCKYLMDNANGGVAVARGWNITHIDVIERLAYLDDGVPIHYQKCLIATGATPKMSTVFKVASADEKLSEKIKLFRNIDDFEEVLEAYDESKSIAIVGGGFLGSELACAMGRKDKHNVKHIYQIFREDGNMGKILPEYLSNWTTDKVRSEGVQVMPKTDVVGVKGTGRGSLEMTLNNGHVVTVDSVVVAVGVEPNTQLAEKSDLEVDPELGGYLVNTELQARTDLYIAGDCACFYDPRLGRRRIEHHDHAVVSGRLAGENMTGARKPYYHQSMFWSDLGPDIGYEAIGIVDSALPTVGIFAKATDQDSPKAVVSATGEGIRSQTEEIPKTCDKYLTDEQKKHLEEERKGLDPSGEDYGKGVIFYLRNDIVVGIVLWNVFNRMSVARQVLKDQRKYDDLNEVAKLFNIHEE